MRSIMPLYYSPTFAWSVYIYICVANAPIEDQTAAKRQFTSHCAFLQWQLPIASSMRGIHGVDVAPLPNAVTRTVELAWETGFAVASISSNRTERGVICVHVESEQIFFQPGI